MRASAFFSTSERQLLAEITAALAPLDATASSPLSQRFEEILDAFAEAGSRELRRRSTTHVAEVKLGVQLDLRDPDGHPFPEVRLQYRRRSRSVVVRKTRQLLGALPPARVLVLTPQGYRLTTLKLLVAKRFVSRRPRLAQYKAASVPNLSAFFDAYYKQMSLTPKKPAPKKSRP